MHSEKRVVVEVCPHCDSENELMWDIETMGYKIFCPVCGKQMMLCDECIHADDRLNENCSGCDWCEDEEGNPMCFRCKQEEKTMIDSSKSLMFRLIKAGYPIDQMYHHDSDLYVHVTPISREVIMQWCKDNGYRREWHCPTFTDQITGKLMFDCAFSYSALIEKAFTKWNEFADVPMDPDTECIESEFEGFPAGTHREEIWRWFEECFCIPVHELLYGGLDG